MSITPNAQDLWEGIGGHFDSFSQIVCEFVDNSIANFQGTTAAFRNIIISIKQENGSVDVMIEDTGSGIADFDPVLRIGDRSLRQSPLNEHGFGLKHALASADIANQNWKIYSRTIADCGRGEYKVVNAPYDYDMKPSMVKITEKPWPGRGTGSGTIVCFTCTENLFNTLQKGIRGAAGFSRCIDYLIEDIGFIYSGVIDKGEVVIIVITSAAQKTVAAVKPEWAGYYPPGQGTIRFDLGGGDINIEYEFGEMKESTTNVRHYKRNLVTSGVEIRINGRLLMNNIFKEIWGVENHPSYNHFLAKVNLVSSERNRLPKTRTSKNGIRSGDDKLNVLYHWIRNTHAKVHKEIAGAVREKELVDELEQNKIANIRSATKSIVREFEVFTRVGSPVPVDLYVYDGNEVLLFEAKKDMADVQNIYQLMMYWDGAVDDGITPSEGILVATSFSPGVDAVLEVINQKTDQNGNQYKLTTTTWHANRIAYPTALP